MGSIDRISPDPEIDNHSVLIIFHIQPLSKYSLNSHAGAYKRGEMFLGDQCICLEDEQKSNECENQNSVIHLHFGTPRFLV